MDPSQGQPRVGEPPRKVDKRPEVIKRYEWRHLVATIVTFTHFPKNAPHDSRTSLLKDMLVILVISPYGEFNHFLNNSPQDPRASLLGEMLGTSLLTPYVENIDFPVFSPAEYGENFDFPVFSRGVVSPCNCLISRKFSQIFPYYSPIFPK